MTDRRRGHDLGKRLLDLVLIILALPALLPVLVMLSLMNFASHGRPILFRQGRAGKGGRVFRIYKYRTMSDGRDSAGKLLPDAARLTSFGRFLRSYSLDELPTLINVVKGDMSLVGPRPLLAHYLPRYDALQSRRHEVLPGVTGWAQVNGRNALSWDEKFACDVWYVDHQSLGLDLKILWLTVIHVFTRRGISAPNHATMPEFLAVAPAPDSAQSVSPLPPNSTPRPES